MPEDPKQCSRCHEKLDTDGYPLWCKACRSNYNAEYRDLRDQMSKGKGFLAGAEAFRRATLTKLHAMPPDMMLRVAETAKWLREFPAPRPE